MKQKKCNDKIYYKLCNKTPYLGAYTYIQSNNRIYSEVSNRQADRNKRAGLEKRVTLLAYLLRKLINEQGGIFHLLHEELRAGWKENLKNLSEHALLLGTSEYVTLPPPVTGNATPRRFLKKIHAMHCNYWLHCWTNYIFNILKKFIKQVTTTLKKPW